MFGGGHKASKLKIDLRLSINRLKLAQKKKTEQAQKARKEIADYLSAGKYERARIRVEHIIREDYIVEAMEVVELYCDLLLARFGLIESMKHCDDGLAEAVCSLIWVAPRMLAEINELRGVSDQLCLKYGKTFGEQARANTTNSVNERLIHRMSVEAPPKVLVEQYLMEIAKSHHVPYEADTMAMMGDEFGGLNDEEEFVPATLPAVPAGVPSANTHNSRGGGGGGGGAAYTAPPPAQQHQQPPQQPQMPPTSYSHPPPVGPGMPQPGPGYPVSPNMPSGQPYPYEPPRTYGQSAPGGFVSPGMPTPGVQGYSAGPPADGSDRAGPLPSKADLAAAEARSQPYPEPTFDLPSVPGDSVGNQMPGTGSGDDLDFDDLTRRFEDLKRKK